MIPRDLLPEGAFYFIAGGWAACPSLATDKDVWVTYPRGTNLVAARQHILDHLKETGYWYTEEQDGRTETVNDGYAGIEVNILKVAVVNFVVPIHILVTDAMAHEVLQGFDVSTHQIVLLSDGGIQYGPDWTPITVPPIKLKNTPTTDARMRKIAARYGHSVEAFVGTQ